MYLTVKNLTLYFGDKRILNSIDFNVSKGEIVTLLGPSGCGKSTLLRTIAGLEKHLSGEIELDGKIIDNIPTKMRNIGFVFQNYALFPNMTVFENIAFGLKVNKLPKDEVENKVSRILQLVDLTEFANRNVKKLSGGQQQRVALARSLVTEPKILLLDEPLSALDAKIRKQLQVDLKRIQRELGITMIFVTHDQEEAMLISDRIYVINEGKVIQSSTPTDLYNKPESKFIAEFIGLYNKLDYNEINCLTNEFNSTGDDYFYYIRPELIKFETGENRVPLKVKLENVLTLGVIKRFVFKTNSNKEIIVDKVNDFKEGIKQVDTLYIDSDNIIPIRREEEISIA